MRSSRRDKLSLNLFLVHLLPWILGSLFSLLQQANKILKLLEHLLELFLLTQTKPAQLNG